MTVAKRMGAGLPGLLLLGMAGCATVARPPAKAPNEGSTSYHMVDDGQMAHYTLALGDVATGGGTIQRVLPDYPPALLAACPPAVDVQAQVIVDAAGKANDVRRYPAAGGPAAPVPPQFFDAVRTAVMQWRFAPLQISHWAADADGNTHKVDDESKPFSLVYAFRFECRAGKATVSSAPAKG
ncbi:hypothetical protein [Rhodanobacter sp. DHB23]|uniref:hypothetical protein n=1 Tax=Rhodanobacter sp. DHB23 TaxID=2775923 RepID=UPI00177D9619|nr:hypothetical protein [Rhodanobacter sp. DHB23]MBD8874441.1 hypothetical protein [Rhodanobacter sp. DHB23]